MKKFNFFIVLFFGVIFLYNCEKDDICAAGTPTTPRLIVAFYDKNTLEVKNISDLRLQDVDKTDFFDFSAVNEIEIPLKTFADATTIKLIKNGTDTDLTNDLTDIITFNYTRTDVYISRACGYKTIFELDALSPFLLVNSSWIDHLEIETFSVLNENETHVKIYF